MSILLSIFMGALAIGGMWNHSDWKYWVSCWAVCALFILCWHVGRFVSILEDKNGK